MLIIDLTAMERHYVFYCLFLGAVSFYQCAALQYRLLEECSTFADAKTACDGINGSNVWTLPLDPGQDKSLTRFMLSQKVSSVWLGMEKQAFDQWKWVTGNNYSSDQFQRYAQPGYHCAGLSLQHQVLHPINCGDQGSGFVCDISDQKQCPEKYHKQACVKKNGYAYLIGCNSNDWYDARRYCRGLHGDLAILDASEKVNMVLDYLVNQKLTGHCGKLYVGLRKEMWIRSANTTELDGEIKDVVWNTGEPVPGQSCARLTVSKYGTQRKTADCSNKNAIVCRADNNSPSPKSSNTEEGENLRSSHTSLKIASICLSVILFCVCCGASVVIFVVRRRRNKEETEKEVKARKRQPKILLEENRKCIVMFSSKLINPKHQHVDITNINYIDWRERKGQRKHTTSGEMKGIHFSEKLVDVLIYSHMLMNQNLSNELKARLHVVNLYSKDYTKSLPDYRLLEILSFLIKQSQAIHVVLLPEFEKEIYETHTVLSKLWELRDKVVVITTATHKPSLPADEVIAVGRHTMKHMIPSGNVDFIVNDTVYPDVNDMSDGFVAGLAAALLDSSPSVKYSKNLNMAKVEDNAGGDKTKLMRHTLLTNYVWEEGLAFEGFGWLQVGKSGIKKKERITKNNAAKTEETSLGIKKEATIESEKTFETIKIGLVRPCSEEKREKHHKFLGLEVDFKEGIYSGLQHAYQEEELPTIEETLQIFCKSKGVTESIYMQKIEIIWFAVLSDLVHLDEHLFKRHLKEMQKCHIVYFTNLIHIPSIDIQRDIFNLTKQSVVLTQALNAKNEFSPCEFPGDRAISIGRTKGDEDKYQKYKYQIEESKGGENKQVGEKDRLITEFSLNLETLHKRRGDQSSGATLDFLCGLDFTNNNGCSSKEVEPQDTKVKPATFQVVALIAIILLRSKKAGVEDEVLRELCNTAVMHNVLRQICTHPDTHDIDEGWGELKPGKLLDSSDDELRKQIQNNANPSKFWAGKNL